MTATTLRMFCFALAGTFALHAGTVAVDLTSPGSEYGGGPWTLGFAFSPVVNISVTALGVYDSGQDGIADIATVGIWDTNGNLLTSGQVPSGTGGTLLGDFRYVSITPFDLTAGTEYVVGSYLADTASSLNTGQGGTGSFDPSITVIEDRYVGSGAFAYPSQNSATAGAWLGANFQFSDTEAAPEPGAFVLVAGGLGALLMRRLRRSRAF